MKQLLIPLVCLTLIGVAGCRQTEKEIVRGYRKDIKAWKTELKPSAAAADSGEQLLINIVFLESFPYDKERPSYVCLAIDGKVVREKTIANRDHRPLPDGIVPLLIEFEITKGKHVFTVFDVAHGLKVEKEIEIVKSRCWVMLSNGSGTTPQEPIRIEIFDRLSHMQ